jgi:hypothetical protein
MTPERFRQIEDLYHAARSVVGVADAPTLPNGKVNPDPRDA